MDHCEHIDWADEIEHQEMLEQQGQIQDEVNILEGEMEDVSEEGDMYRESLQHKIKKVVAKKTLMSVGAGDDIRKIKSKVAQAARLRTAREIEGLEVAAAQAVADARRRAIIAPEQISIETTTNLIMEETIRACIAMVYKSQAELSDDDIKRIYDEKAEHVITMMHDSQVNRYHDAIRDAVFRFLPGAYKEVSFRSFMETEYPHINIDGLRDGNKQPDIFLSKKRASVTSGFYVSPARRFDQVYILEIKTGSNYDGRLAETVEQKYEMVRSELVRLGIKAEIVFVNPDNFVDVVMSLNKSNPNRQAYQTELNVLKDKHQTKINTLRALAQSINADINKASEAVQFSHVQDILAFENIIPRVVEGFNDDPKWREEEYTSFEELAADFSQNNYQIDEMGFEATTVATIQGAFKSLWDKNDEQLPLEIPKPSLAMAPSSEHKTAEDFILNEVMSAHGKCTGFLQELCTALNASRYNRRTGLKEKVFDRTWNSLRIRPRDLFQIKGVKNGVFQEQYDKATSRRGQSELRTIHSSKADEYERDIEDVIRVMSEKDDVPVRLLDGSKEHIVEGGDIVELARKHSDIYLKEALYTRAAKIARSMESAGKCIMNQQNKARKCIYLHDGGSTDMFYVFMPHGPVNMDKNVVKFFTVSRAPTLDTCSRIVDVCMMNGKTYHVSQIFSVNQQRVVAMKNIFHNAMAFALTQGTTFRGKMETKLRYTRESFAVAVLIGGNTNQDISALLDISKYLCNASQSLLSNIHELVVEKCSVHVKSKLTCYLIKKLEDWSMVLCKMNSENKNKTMVIDNSEDGVDPECLGLKGCWPSLYFDKMHTDYKTFQNETAGLFVLRQKQLMGGQEMPKQYIRLVKYDQVWAEEIGDNLSDYEHRLKEEMKERMFWNPVDETNLRSMNAINTKVIRFITRMFFDEIRINKDEYYRNMTRKGLEDNIATICSLNGVVKDLDSRKTELDLHSTSIREAVSLIKEYDEKGVEASVIQVANDHCDKDLELIISLKEQRGGTRPITSMTLKNKCAFRVLEMSEQCIGEFDPSNIIVPRLVKLKKIYEMCVSTKVAVAELNLQSRHNVEEGGVLLNVEDLIKFKIESQQEQQIEPNKLPTAFVSCEESSLEEPRKPMQTYYFTEDKTKFSETFNVTAFMHYFDCNPLYSDGFVNYCTVLMSNMRKRKLYYKHKITEAEKAEDGNWCARDSMSNSYCRLKTGWAQGFLNNTSTNLSSVANWGAHKIFETIVKRSVPYNNLVHSDDSCCAVGLYPDEVPLYFTIRNKMARLFSLKISLTKSYVSDKYCEVVSHFCVNGEVFQPYIKQCVGMMSEFSHSGPDKDTVDMLNRVKDCYRLGAPLVACSALKSIGMDKIHSLFLNGPGQANDPQTILKEELGLDVDRTLVPLGLFGSPRIDILTLCVAGAVADERLKIRTIQAQKYQRGLSQREKLGVDGLRFALSVAYLEKTKNCDMQGANASVLGGLKLHSGTCKFKTKSIDFVKSLSGIEEGKSFPLHMPNKGNMYVLEFMKDTCQTKVYQDAVNKASQDLIATHRRLMLMVKGKSWSWNEELMPKELNLTESQHIAKASNSRDLFTAAGALTTIFKSGAHIDNKPKILQAELAMAQLIRKDKLLDTITMLCSNLKVVRLDRMDMPVTVNRPPMVDTSEIHPMNLMRVLMSLFMPEKEKEMYPNKMHTQDEIAKSLIADRFGHLISRVKDRRERMQLAVMIYNILNAERSRTTPYFCPRIRGRELLTFFRQLIERTVLSGIKVTTAFISQNVNVENELVLSSPARSMLQTILFAKINEWDYDIRRPVSKRSLDVIYSTGNDTQKKVAALTKLEYYFDKSLVDDFITRNYNFSKDVIVQQKVVTTPDKKKHYVGVLEIEIRRNTTFMRIRRADYLPRKYWVKIVRSMSQREKNMAALCNQYVESPSLKTGIISLNTNVKNGAEALPLFREYLDFMHTKYEEDIDDLAMQYDRFAHYSGPAGKPKACLCVYPKNLHIDVVEPSRTRIPITTYVKTVHKKKVPISVECPERYYISEDLSLMGVRGDEHVRLFSVPLLLEGLDYSNCSITSNDGLGIEISGHDLRRLIEHDDNGYSPELVTQIENIREVEELTSTDAVALVDMMLGNTAYTYYNTQYYGPIEHRDEEDVPNMHTFGGTRGNFDADEDMPTPQIIQIEEADLEEYCNLETMDEDELAYALMDEVDISKAHAAAQAKEAPLVQLQSDKYRTPFVIPQSDPMQVIKTHEFTHGSENRGYYHYPNIYNFLRAVRLRTPLNVDAFLKGLADNLMNGTGVFKKPEDKEESYREWLSYEKDQIVADVFNKNKHIAEKIKIGYIQSFCYTMVGRYDPNTQRETFKLERNQMFSQRDQLKLCHLEDYKVWCTKSGSYTMEEFEKMWA